MTQIAEAQRAREEGPSRSVAPAAAAARASWFADSFVLFLWRIVNNTSTEMRPSRQHAAASVPRHKPEEAVAIHKDAISNKRPNPRPDKTEPCEGEKGGALPGVRAQGSAPPGNAEPSRAEQTRPGAATTYPYNNRQAGGRASGHGVILRPELRDAAVVWGVNGWRGIWQD